MEAGPNTLAAKTSSLKTLNPSRILKISNVFDREAELTPDVYEELKEDFEGEMAQITQLRSMRVVRSGEATLGSEVGSIFVEFRDKKGAELGIKKVKGRIYDGNEIKVVYIDEKLYFENLFPDKNRGIADNTN